MRKGAQLRYVRQLEKPTAFRKTLSISDIYIYIYIYIYICCKCLIFIKLHPFLEIRQLFAMLNFNIWNFAAAKLGIFFKWKRLPREK